MLCQHCKKREAVVNYAGSNNGKKFSCHLCKICYAEMFGEINSQINKAVMAGLFGKSVRRVQICPVCGTTFDDYERTGLVGCASCYDVFKEQLMPSILRIHGKAEHIGKVGNNNDELGLHRRLKTLQEQLEEAIRERRYGEADRLNRQINSIKKTLHGGGNG